MGERRCKPTRSFIGGGGGSRRRPSGRQRWSGRFADVPCSWPGIEPRFFGCLTFVPTDLSRPRHVACAVHAWPTELPVHYFVNWPSPRVCASWRPYFLDTGGGQIVQYECLSPEPFRTDRLLLIFFSELGIKCDWRFEVDFSSSMTLRVVTSCNVAEDCPFLCRNRVSPRVRAELLFRFLQTTLRFVPEDVGLQKQRRYTIWSSSTEKIPYFARIQLALYAVQNWVTQVNMKLSVFTSRKHVGGEGV